jgi:hypothetical protein
LECQDKVDSLLVVVPQPKPAAMDRVLAAFAQVGLDVTDNSGSMVEAKTGAKSNLTGARY